MTGTEAISLVFLLTAVALLTLWVGRLVTTLLKIVLLAGVIYFGVVYYRTGALPRPVEVLRSLPRHISEFLPHHISAATVDHMLKLSR